MPRQNKQKCCNPRQQSLIVIGVGMFLMSLWLFNWWRENVRIQIEKQAVLAYQLAPLPNHKNPRPTHIFIRWFVDTDVREGVISNGKWTIDNNAATYLAQSGRPRENGNIIIYGHNTRQILGNIRALKGGEQITLTLSDGSTRLYKVKTLQQVKATAIDYLKQTETEILTLYTCAGFADGERFVVQAVPAAVDYSNF